MVANGVHSSQYRENCEGDRRGRSYVCVSVALAVYIALCVIVILIKDFGVTYDGGHDSDKDHDHAQGDVQADVNGDG